MAKKKEELSQTVQFCVKNIHATHATSQLLSPNSKGLPLGDTAALRTRLLCEGASISPLCCPHPLLEQGAHCPQLQTQLPLTARSPALYLESPAEISLQTLLSPIVGILVCQCPVLWFTFQLSICKTTVKRQ